MILFACNVALGKFAEPKIEELLEVLQGNPVIIWNLRYASRQLQKLSSTALGDVNDENTISRYFNFIMKLCITLFAYLVGSL